MIRLLARKYKIMKRRQDKLPVVSVDHDNFYKQLYEIYSIYDKEQLSSIEDTMVQYKDKESVLLEQLYEKYNISDHHYHLIGCDKYTFLEEGVHGAGTNDRGAHASSPLENSNTYKNIELSSADSGPDLQLLASIAGIDGGGDYSDDPLSSLLSLRGGRDGDDGNADGNGTSSREEKSNNDDDNEQEGSHPGETHETVTLQGDYEYIVPLKRTPCTLSYMFNTDGGDVSFALFYTEPPSGGDGGTYGGVGARDGGGTDDGTTMPPTVLRPYRRVASHTGIIKGTLDLTRVGTLHFCWSNRCAPPSSYFSLSLLLPLQDILTSLFPLSLSSLMQS